MILYYISVWDQSFAYKLFFHVFPNSHPCTLNAYPNWIFKVIEKKQLKVFHNFLNVRCWPDSLALLNLK